ncbi:DUF4861 family protein [Alteromonas pelagimontana]|uniref:DUF4861 family protein n=1 Tax=Alteromonas pelagimontana TaxID=1858656 RepID=A0A6M4MDN1_9ALTE|nr:DUF4861 family protein [Alteromonas pelagimontana]QJR81127.1 DUF4861 family protein [Alteromonas pelagimontana]
MTAKYVTGAVIAASLLIGCSAKEDNEKLQFSVKNPAQGSSLPQLVSLSASDVQGSGGKSLVASKFPSEWVTDNQGKRTLNVLIESKPGQTQALELASDGVETKDVAYAELAVRQGGKWEGKSYEADGFTFKNVKIFTSPAQLTDHSYYLRYEGPGWENDLIGYRLYLDWRNGIDIFVKTGNEPVLSEVGQDGYDSYHELTEWGADALKVGKNALGLGSIGRLDGDTVMHMQNVDNTHWKLLSDNKLSASFNVIYEGWEVASKKTDASTQYDIHAGDPTTHVTVSLSTPVDNLVTGVVKHPGVEFIQQELGDWGVFATFGKQSLLGEDDELGMAVFYRLDQTQRTFETDYDYLVQFKPSAQVEYGFLAVWPKHPDSPKDAAGFKALLTEKLKALEHPVTLAKAQ